MSTDDNDDKPGASTSSLYPIGFAIGVAVVLVGLVVSWPAIVVGGAIALVFGFLWVRDLTVESRPETEATEGAADADEHVPTYDRSGFLTASTIGLGGVIGAAITLPVLGFAVLPSFEGESVETRDVDLGPITNFREGEYVIATYLENPDQGEVSRRTTYVRHNGRADNGEPSFTLLFSRCVHLGCPVQPNGPLKEDEKVTYKGVTLIPTDPAGFGCPCHGGQYDNEGNRTAGPPVRSLDRYEFSIKDGNLILGRLFSVGDVQGAGAGARIEKYRRAYPGVHVDGPEGWLYPIPVPGTGS